MKLCPLSLSNTHQLVSMVFQAIQSFSTGQVISSATLRHIRLGKPQLTSSGKQGDLQCDKLSNQWIGSARNRNEPCPSDFYKGKAVGGMQTERQEGYRASQS